MKNVPQKTTHNKLVRDRIPEIIRKKGGWCRTREVRGEEYLGKLLEKLVEEAQECASTPTAEEIADILEVLDAIARHLEITKLKINTSKRAKARIRGKFNDGIVLIETEE